MIDMGGNGNNNPRQPPGPPPPPPPPPPPLPLQQCPRCNSFNTKFCYYNNHCVSQPRYLCKSCRRYWTQGGSLRSVPIKGDLFKGTKWFIRGGLAFGAPSSCSSSFIGESSRSQELPLPPSLPQLSPPHVRGFSNGSLPFANFFGESSTNFSLWQGFSGNPNSMRPQQRMVPRSGPSGTNNQNQSPDDVDVDVDDYLNYSPPPPSSPSSSS